MKKIKFELTETIDYPEPEPPEGGWREPCSYKDHRWGLEIEEGHVNITCLDPCDERLYDPSSHRTCACLYPWEPEDFTTPETIAIELTYVDDSTPSTPAGPAEYGYYIEVRVITEADSGSAPST